MHYLPGRKLELPVDRKKVLSNGTVQIRDSALITDAVRWEITGNSLIKNEMMLLDILAENNWDRPIYFAISAPPIVI
jgi:hypothetical protein